VAKGMDQAAKAGQAMLQEENRQKYTAAITKTKTACSQSQRAPALSINKAPATARTWRSWQEYYMCQQPTFASK